MSVYGVPPAHPQTSWTPPPKKRPKALWWVGGGLLVLAAVVFAILFALVLHDTRSALLGNFQASSDGTVYTVVLSRNEDTVLMSNTSGAHCSVHDHGTGAPIPLTVAHVADSSDRAGWQTVGRFRAPATGVVDIGCTDPGASWNVTSFDAMMALGFTALAMLVVPAILVVAALVLLVIALALTLSRPKPPTYAGWPGQTAPGRWPGPPNPPGM